MTEDGRPVRILTSQDALGVNFGAIPEAALQRIDRNAFAAAFLNALDRLVATYAAGGASALLAGWRENGGLDARE